jgi:hypothetical protein
MYNPYHLLTEPILAAMLRQPMYFVRQHYPRGLLYEDETKIPLLFTHYIHHDSDKERAERHIRLLLKDPYRFLYNSAHPGHLEKLRTAASQPAGYRIYINLLPGKWKAGDALKLKISRYVKEKMPWWNYSPKDKLNVTLKERYGELFIALLWRGQQTEVLLEDIESFNVCATT